MTARIYLIAAAVVVLLLAGWRVYAHIDRQAFDRGQAEGRRIAASATAQYGECAAALGIADAQARSEQQRAKDAMLAGERAAAGAREEAKAADDSLRAWRARYVDAMRTPSCARTLELELCSAVLDY